MLTQPSYSKEPQEAEVKPWTSEQEWEDEPPQPEPGKVLDLTPDTGEATYRYVPFPVTTVRSRSGDLCELHSFEVYYGNQIIGHTSIWHNRYGAFAQFTDILNYPKSGVPEDVRRRL